MAFIPFANVAEVAMRYTCDTQLCVNTLGFRKGTPYSEADLEALVTEIFGVWGSFLKPLQVPTLFLSSVYAISLEADDAPTFELNGGAGDHGTASANPLPLNVTAAITFRTALRGRSYRGRNFVPAIPDTAWDGVNQITATYRDNIIGAYEDMMSNILTDVGATHVVLSRQHNGVIRVTGVSTPVTSYTMDLNIDSMRKRLTGRGV